ncbi:hypothetical protein BU26DRAFT_600910 [Trematosphaeria pertusa]|uniref:Uncharacterized protein n=1 Tax=Trematosphaeria pertusa TaxID=390896 RepID=A0A6A6IZB1_9PLEO|nr:uncharacterized protein BU26DRAFT_600910 [Trematosphaeria pertusa]KAF2255397.1 hypothetical protein BU26DRAFT_600910 [Trematosphaeria pertusa]
MSNEDKGAGEDYEAANNHRRIKRIQMGLAEELHRRPAASSQLLPGEGEITTGHPGFMDLSRELRDMVYHLLWKATPGIVVPHKMADLSVSYEDYPWFEKRATLPMWLLTNTSILKEGVQQLLFRATWSWSYTRAKYPSLRSPLLIPIQAKEITMRVEAEALILLGPKDRLSGTISLEPKHSYDFADLEEIFRKSIELKTLRLDIMIWTKAFRQIWPKNVDFSLLDPFDRLFDKWIVTVYCPKLQGDRKIAWHHTLQSNLKMEIARIGRLMVGDHVEERVVVVDDDWYEHEESIGRVREETRATLGRLGINGSPEKMWRFEFTKQEPERDICQSLS